MLFNIKYVDVLLPVPLNRSFTYALPAEWPTEVSTGIRVVVPFGKSRVLTGIVVGVHENEPRDYEAKPVIEILDEAPILTTKQLQLIHWMSDYYMCTAGEVLNAALPAGLKISSESKIQLHPQFNEEMVLDQREILIIEGLKAKNTLSYTEAAALIGNKQVSKILKSLDQKEAIVIFEEIRERYSPKTEKIIRLTREYQSEEALKKIFEDLSSKAKQEEVLLAYLQKTGVGKRMEQGVPKAYFREKSLSISSVNTLVKNKIFEEYENVISRFEKTEISEELPELTEHQYEAFGQLLSHFEQKQTVLLHGITGSGKTAIYVKLIEQTLENGHQALLLLPEIALTTQIVVRLKRVFGDKMGVYHSRFSDNERVEVWKGVLDGTYNIIVGVRSSLFLPFDNLGLVIVDEEHENSYKQYDPAPRYHARDSALMLVSLHDAKALLGSATPSVESYFLAESGKYGLVELSRRYGKASMPEVKAVDLSRAVKRKEMKGIFSDELVNRIEKALSEKRQVIIFQNRRGYAPFLECQNCGWVPKCINCSVSLTYHQYQKQLRCHYCGYNEKMPGNCEECTSTLLKTMGFGTEKLEEDLMLLLPEARIQRMDLETTRAKNSYQRIIDDFTQAKTDILIGTQMVTKGLDFENVGLVGIVDFDRMLHFPDFRSFERTFNLALQVSGRAGRSEQTGEVYIQTYNPDQNIISLIRNADYIKFYNSELNDRSRFHYPPYTRLIRITLKHRDRLTVTEAANIFFKALAAHFESNMLLGPEAPMISRIKNRYLMDITLKITRKNASLSATKEIIKHEAMVLQQHPVYKNVQFVYDVDPY